MLTNVILCVYAFRSVNSLETKRGWKPGCTSDDQCPEDKYCGEYNIVSLSFRRDTNMLISVNYSACIVVLRSYCVNGPKCHFDCYHIRLPFTSQSSLDSFQLPSWGCFILPITGRLDPSSSHEVRPG